MQFTLIGNPENRRVDQFAAALERRGHPRPTQISWELLAEDPTRLEALPNSEQSVRIDSAGESFHVERRFLHRGYRPGAAGQQLSPDEVDALSEDFGRILPPAQAHRGFVEVLHAIDETARSRPGWSLTADPGEVQELFDKRRTSARLHEAGLPVPLAVPGVRTPDELFDAMRSRDLKSAYVKVACASSASCLALVLRGSRGFSAWTTVEMTPTAWYNSLRLRRVQRPADLEALLGFLLAEGAQVEEAVPKARLDGAWFDTRVLTIAGEPRFTVVRQSRHPITNLHLGGHRGDLEALRARTPEATRADVRDACRRVAAFYPGCLHLGIDLMYEPGFRDFRILEINAFGDLLPGLRSNGETVYEAQIRALEEGWGRAPADPRRRPAPAPAVPGGQTR